MQRVERTIPNRLRVSNEIDLFYAYTSEREQLDKSIIPPTFDFSFRSLVDVFNQYDDDQFHPLLVDKHYEPIELPIYNQDTVILCFSGGKDSVATALLYKEMGYKVYLYYMKHINPALSDEWKCAQECADLLGLPIFFDDVRLKGHHDWMEHPMKNMIIATGALEYGIRENIGTRIAFGNYQSSVLEDNVFERCAGDCVDMWTSYEDIIKQIIPNFTIDVILENMGQTLTIVTPMRELLDASVSCLCRHSLREYRHTWVKEKFGIELPNHRCGSCYKCCVEYIYMADHNLIDFSEDYYKYCFNQLYKVTLDENNMQYFPASLWDMYMFYPIEQSKIKDKILNARMFKRNLKWE